jgi:hypothetical protein
LLNLFQSLNPTRLNQQTEDSYSLFKASFSPGECGDFLATFPRRTFSPINHVAEFLFSPCANKKWKTALDGLDRTSARRIFII